MKLIDLQRIWIEHPGIELRGKSTEFQKEFKPSKDTLKQVTSIPLSVAFVLGLISSRWFWLFKLRGTSVKRWRLYCMQPTLLSAKQDDHDDDYSCYPRTTCVDHISFHSSRDPGASTASLIIIMFLKIPHIYKKTTWKGATEGPKVKVLSLGHANQWTPAFLLIGWKGEHEDPCHSMLPDP